MNPINQPSTNSHLPGLDGLRAVAALVVLVYHIELTKSFNKLPNLMEFSFYQHTGGRIGVILFFVLSGFLITRNLLEDKRQRSKIPIAKFYLKRILRIWPLYYLTLVLSAWLLNYTPQTTTLWMCLLIFPNIAHATVGGWVASPQVWSIGAEEQFYLAWPWLLKVLKKNILKVLVILFFIITIAPFLLTYIVDNYFNEPGRSNTIQTIFNSTKFNCMILGGIFAYVIRSKPEVLNFIKGKAISVGITLVPFILWFSGVHIPFLNDEFYALLFGLLIVNVSHNNGGGIFLNNMGLNYLGKISFGIYMFHHLAIILGLRYVPPVFLNNLIASNVIYYFIVLSLTIGAASLSYFLFEKRFLKLKESL